MPADPAPFWSREPVYTDHSMRYAAQGNTLANELGIAAETPLPQGVAEDGNVIAVRAFFIIGKPRHRAMSRPRTSHSKCRNTRHRLKPVLRFADVAVCFLDLVSRRGQVLADLARDHYGAVMAARASERDREIAFPLADVV